MADSTNTYGGSYEQTYTEYNGGTHLMMAHRQFVAELSSYYLESASGRGKDILGFDKPLPPLPPHVPHNDGLFAVYVASFVTVVIIPVTIKLVYDLLCCHSSPARNQRSLLVRSLVVVIGFVVVWQAVVYSQSLNDCNYQLLGLDPTMATSLTADDIKQAWRQKALQHHPDKQHTEDPSSTYIQIAKAYHALVRQHGGSVVDGDSSYPLFLALPTWLQQVENYQWIMIGYFLFLFLVVPFFLCAIRSSVFTSSLEDNLKDLLSYEMKKTPKKDVDYFDFSDDEED